MSNASSQKSWHDSPNAPNITSQVYFNEKANLAGMHTCAAFYGGVVLLFFRCMSALLDPVNRTRGSIKWLLIVHTVAIFLFVTVFTVINLNVLSVSYVDNRETHGGPEPPGPLGYQYSTYSTISGVVSTIMFLLNNLLADGLLLYRCYVMYAASPWAIIFPCLLYLATVAMGIMLVYYQISQPGCSIWRSTTVNVGVPYSISVSLDILLTFMIIARIITLSRQIRSVMNAPFKISGLYKAIVTILCESSALYAVTFLLWVGTWATNNPAEYFLFPILAQTQVMAPFLIILHVVNQKESTGYVVSGDIGSYPSSQGESTDASGTPPSRHSAGLGDTGGKTPGGLGIKVVTTIDLHHDKI